MSKELALAKHFNVTTTVDIENPYGDVYTIPDQPGEYLVLTSDEAETAHDEALENYIDECILPECPPTIAPYFDRDAWKRDARYDGRGHVLASYDGDEHEVKIDGEWFYIYRVN